MKNHTAWLLITAMVFMYACGSSEKPVDRTADQKNEQVNIPVFSADSAYAYVEKQVDFGPRVPGSDAHSSCAQWLESTMNRFADTVIVQTFKARAYNGEVLRGKNIISSFNVEKKKRVLLCAHWDSRPYADHDPDEANHDIPIDGANDGASGVGVLIEIARQFSLQNPATGVDIIFFDLEDYGPPQDAQSGATETWGLGSQYWSRNHHKPAYRARYGILLDMVGVKDATFLMEGFSMMYAPSRVKKIWDIAAGLGYDSYFPQEFGSYITDDHYFINTIANIPTVNIIHLENDNEGGSFFKHWHTMNDNMEHIDKNTLALAYHE
jgi:hypothetical protein